MINTRIALSLMSIVAALAVVGATTFAYFIDSDEGTGNTFATGTLSIDLLNQNTNDPFQGEALITNWAPGETAFVNFDVLNDGTLPVYLRGFATGEWIPNSLDASLVKVTKVERWNGSGWEKLGEDENGLTGEFYYSTDGTESSLIALEPNQRAQIQLTVVLDGSAGNEYQGKEFVSSLFVQAKQTTEGATWDGAEDE